MVKKQVNKVSPNPFVNWNKLWEAFSQCIIAAKSGKTFVYLATDFVCMDAETYQKLNNKPSMEILYFDEFVTMTPAKMKEFEKAWSKVQKSVQQVRSSSKTD